MPAEATDLLSQLRAGQEASSLESQHVDFKTQSRRSKDDTYRDLAEAAACFANADGGLIVVGVDDSKAGAGAIVGCDLDPDATKLRVYQLTEPPLVVECRGLIDGRDRLLTITVPASPTVHAVRGRSSERVGSACMPMMPQRIADVLGFRSGYDWSAQASKSSTSDIDPLAMAELRSQLEKVDGPSHHPYARQSDSALLRTLGLVANDAGLLNNSGALLLVRGFTSNAEIAYTFRRTASGSLVASAFESAPILLALRRVTELIDARVDRFSVNLPGGQQLQVPDLPGAAVREALVNAIMHRDYRAPGRISVEHSPARMAVTSPGSFPPGVTQENVLTTPSRPRNRTLAAAIRMLGLAETAGSGIDRMYAEMTRIGLAPPIFSSDAVSVAVRLFGGAPNVQLTRFTASLPRDEADDADTMLILLTLLSRRTVTAESVAALLQKAPDEAEDVLRRLSAPPVSILEPTRRTVRRSRPDYHLRADVITALGTAVTYHRRGIDDYDRKIVSTVTESGSINSRLVQLLFDVNTREASRLLADLVRRGILVKTSAAARGPSVRYGRGPNFAAPRRRRPKKEERP